MAVTPEVLRPFENVYTVGAAVTVTLTVEVAAAYVVSAALVAVTVHEPAVDVAVKVLPLTVQLAAPVVTA